MLQLALTVCILACIGLQSIKAISPSFACMYWALQQQKMNSTQLRCLP